MVIAVGYNSLILSALQQYFEDAAYDVTTFDMSQINATRSLQSLKPTPSCCLLDLSYNTSSLENDLAELKDWFSVIPTVVLHNYKRGSEEALSEKVNADKVLSIHTDPDKIVKAVSDLLESVKSESNR